MVSVKLIVGVGTNTSLTAKLIRGATHSEFSHAWLEVVEDTIDEQGIRIQRATRTIHAQPKGIIVQPVETVHNNYPIHRRFLIRSSQVVLNQGIKRAESLMGTKYDYGVIPNGIKLWWWYLTGTIISPTRNKHKLHCSEFVCIVLKHMKLLDSENLDPEIIHPGKLFNFMSGNYVFQPL